MRETLFAVNDLSQIARALVVKTLQHAHKASVSLGYWGIVSFLLIFALKRRLWVGLQKVYPQSIYFEKKIEEKNI